METNNTTFGPRWLLVSVGVLLAVFLILMSVERGYRIKDEVKGTSQNTFPVTGEGKVTATPDLATVNLGVLTQGDSARTVQDESSKKISKIIEFVKSQGIADADISTSQFNIYPNQDYRDGRQIITGYQASQTITIKVRGVEQSTEKLGKVIAGVTDNGANQINGVSLSFDDPDKLREDAQKEAIENAKQKAQELAKTAGLKLGRIVSITDNGGYYPPVPYADGYGGAAVEKSFAPNIQPGSQDIIANMTIVFELK